MHGKDANADTPAPASSRRRRLTAWLLLGLLLVLLALLFDWNWLKGPIERRVEAATGREFDIVGDLDVDLSLNPLITADGLRLGNVAWSKDPQMLEVERLQLRIALWPLLRGEIQLPQLDVVRPRIVLEKNAEDVGNWIFGDGGAPAPALPDLSKLTVTDGEFVYREAATRTAIRLDIATGPPRAQDQAAPLALEGDGRWRGQTFHLQGRIESPLSLTDETNPYRVNLSARAGATRARVRGGLTGPLTLRGFDLRMALSGDNLADLYPLLGVALPDTPPYALDGRLGRVGAVWRYDDFVGKVGDSDLGGDASVDIGGERLFLKAELVSKRLDFDDLAGFIGAPPQTEGGEVASAEQRREAARQAARPRVLPDKPYDLAKLRSMDADVKLHASRINAKLPLDDMTVHVLMEGGLIRLEPLNFGVADGDIESRIRLDARSASIRTTANIKARRLDLPRLFPQAEIVQDSIGRLGGDFRLTGRGNSVAQMLGSADGDIRLGMGKGRISNLLLEFAGLDLAEILKFTLGKDRTVPILCVVGDFAVRDGVMDTRTLLFDTTDTVVTGQGTISLRDERLDLRLSPLPKGPSIFVLRSPLHIRGTFKDPTIRPDAGRLTLRGVAAVALGIIAPPAAILAMIELGPGQDSDCGAALQK